MVNGVTPEQLAKHYPRLYHMADGESWEGIQQHGLLCTRALVELFEVSPEERTLLLDHQRTKSFTIRHPAHGKAVIRDQKPLNRSKLESSLQDCTFQQWLDLLNSRVFFWLTKERLRTLMCAREYCVQTHIVLELDTLSIAKDLPEHITLAPMNTGNTRPFAHPRGLATFSRMPEYPFLSRLPRGPYYTVVELAVEVGLPKVTKYLIQVAKMKCSSCDRTSEQSLELIEKLHP